MQKLPHALKAVVDQLVDLPGVGPKSALRMGLVLLKWPEEKVQSLGNSLLKLRDSLCLCSLCGSLSETDPCEICSDPSRRDDQLLVIADWDSLLTLENAGFYRGRYLVLGGLLAPLDGIQSGGLEMERLRKRLRESEVRELILALGTTRDGEATESYIINLLHKEFPHLQVTRLAQGIPVGSELKFVDQETLKQSMTYRQQLS